MFSRAVRRPCSQKPVCVASDSGRLYPRRRRPWRCCAHFTEISGEASPTKVDAHPQDGGRYRRAGRSGYGACGADALLGATYHHRGVHVRLINLPAQRAALRSCPVLASDRLGVIAKPDTPQLIGSARRLPRGTSVAAMHGRRVDWVRLPCASTAERGLNMIQRPLFAPLTGRACDAVLWSVPCGLVG